MDAALISAVATVTAALARIINALARVLRVSQERIVAFGDVPKLRRGSDIRTALGYSTVNLSNVQGLEIATEAMARANARLDLREWLVNGCHAQTDVANTDNASPLSRPLPCAMILVSSARPLTLCGIGSALWGVFVTWVGQATTAKPAYAPPAMIQ